MFHCVAWGRWKQKALSPSAMTEISKSQQLLLLCQLLSLSNCDSTCFFKATKEESTSFSSFVSFTIFQGPGWSPTQNSTLYLHAPYSKIKSCLPKSYRSYIDLASNHVEGKPLNFYSLCVETFPNLLEDMNLMLSLCPTDSIITNTALQSSTSPPTNLFLTLVPINLAKLILWFALLPW